MSSTKCYCLHVIWFHMIFVPKLSLDLVLIIYFWNGVQGNETDSRPSSRAGSPSKFRKISGGSLSRYSTKDECLLLEVDCVSITIIPLLTNDVIVRKSWKVLKCGAIQLQEWEYEQLGLEQRGGREGQEDPGAGGHPQEAEGAHGDFAGTCVDDLHNSQLIPLLVSREKCSCPKMTISPNLYPRSQMKFPTFKSLNSMEGRKSVQTLGKKLPCCIFDFSIERVWSDALSRDSWHLFNYMENWLEKWEVKITSERSPRNISLTWLTVQRLPAKRE